MAKDDQKAGIAELAVANPLDRADRSKRDAEMALLAVASDLSLSIAPDGTIVDLTISAPELVRDGAEAWRGCKLGDIVTVESKPKIADLLAEAIAGGAPRWRQVTHPTPNGDVPIRYACVASGGQLFVIGRDLRTTAAIQQRLLQTQQALERDYMKIAACGIPLSSDVRCFRRGHRDRGCRHPADHRCQPGRTPFAGADDGCPAAAARRPQSAIRMHATT